MTKLYAVYGTLKKNNGNHYILKNSKFVGNTFTKPEYNFFAVGSSFPAITLNGNKAIPIEVYEVKDPSVERDLDRLEGYRGEGEDNFYNKTVIDTDLGPCNIYIFNKTVHDSFANLTPIDTW